MQYQVPQFIDSEDKVVGPFSLRQFIFIGAAAVVCGISYFFLQTWLFVIVTIVALGGAVAFAFLKINGRPLIKVATAAFNFYWKPQMYVWKPDHPAITARRRQTTPSAASRALPVIGKETESRSIATHTIRTQGGAPNVSAAEPAENSTVASASSYSASASALASPSSPTSSPSSPLSTSTSIATSMSAPAEESAPEDTRELPSIKTIAQGDSLHKSWENLQTGTPEVRKTSDRQFLEKKMAERYQIFQRQTGERAAARRVDYR